MGLPSGVFRSRDIHNYAVTYPVATLKWCICICVGSKPRSCHFLSVCGLKNPLLPVSSDPKITIVLDSSPTDPTIILPLVLKSKLKPGHVAPNARANLGALQVESDAASQVVHHSCLVISELWKKWLEFHPETIPNRFHGLIIKASRYVRNSLIVSSKPPPIHGAPPAMGWAAAADQQ